MGSYFLATGLFEVNYLYCHHDSKVIPVSKTNPGTVASSWSYQVAIGGGTLIVDCITTSW